MFTGFRTALTILLVIAAGECFLNPIECKVAPINGFLKSVCTHQLSNLVDLSNMALFQCHNSKDYYFALKSERWSFNATCPRDPLHYEMCGYLNGVEMTSLNPQEGLCGVGVCQTGSYYYPRAMLDICRQTRAPDQCRDEQFEGVCNSVKQDCNGVCDDDVCRDEIHCGEYTYGYRCSGQSVFLPLPLHVSLPAYPRHSVTSVVYPMILDLVMEQDWKPVRLHMMPTTLGCFTRFQSLISLGVPLSR